MAGGGANPGMFGQALAEQDQQRKYGQFTGYTPIPGAPNAYNFQTASGQQVPFVGQQAEQLRGSIDAAKNAPSQVNTMFTTKGGGQLALKEGGDAQNPLDWVVREGPRAATRGGMVEAARQSQGGYNVDEQFLGQMEESKIRQAAAEERGQTQALEAASERQGFMQAQKAQLEREAAVQANEAAAKQKRMGDLQAKYEQAESEFMNFHENREKGVAGSKEKMANFIGGLAGALGALGASLARTPNFAAEAVARNREMMMRREEAELRVKKESKDSLLGQLNEQTGNLELAKSAYRAIQSKQSALGWEALAAKEQDAQKQTTMLRTAEIENQNYLKWREDYTRKAEGEVTRSFKFVPGQSGSRGGVRAPTLEEAQGAANLSKTYAETDRTRNPSKAAMTAEERAAAHERTNALTAMGNAVDAADRIEKNLRTRGYGEDSTFDNPLSGPVDALSRAGSALVGGDRKKLDNQLEADTFEMARGLQLAYGKSDNDAIMANQQAAGEGSASDRMRAAQQTRTRAIKTLRTELSTLPPGQQQELLGSLSPDARKAVMGEK